MLKFGYIKECEPAKGRAKVVFDGDDDMVSAWLRMSVKKSKDDKFDFGYDIDEHVAVLMDEHAEEGVIICAIYSDKESPATGNKDLVGVTFKDGTRIEYDRAGHSLNINVGSGTIKLTCDELQVTGDISTTGDISATGDIKATGNVTAGPLGIYSLEQHTHGGVTVGSGVTSTPIPL